MMKINAASGTEGACRRTLANGTRSKTWTIWGELGKNFDTRGGGGGEWILSQGRKPNRFLIADTRPLAEAMALSIGTGNAAAEGDFGGKQAGQQIEEFVKKVGDAMNGFLPEGLAHMPQMPPENPGAAELDARTCHERIVANFMPEAGCARRFVPY
jgi:hypothetical protein